MVQQNRRKKNHGTLPSHVRYLDEVAKTGVRGSQRAILLAAVRWLDWERWVLWPAVGNWAELAGIDVRTLQRGLSSLGALDLVEQRDWGSVNYGPAYEPNTNLYRMLPTVSVTGEVDDTPGGERHATTGGWSGIRDTPGVEPPKPSIIRTYQEPDIEHHQARASRMDRTANTERWIAKIGNAADSREALEIAGIKGDNLGKLARLGIPPMEIAEQVRSLRDEKGVGNLQAVLVHRLKQKVGEPVVNSPEVSRAAAQLEEIRRRASLNGGNSAPASV